MAFLFCLLISFWQPAPVDSHLKQGLLALNRGDLAEARSQLEEASHQQPKNPYCWTSLAQTYLRLNETSKAEAAAAQARKLAPQDPVITRALGIFYFGYAQTLLHKEDFTHAADVLIKALDPDPDNAQLVLALGVARYGQRRFEEAIAEFLKVIRIDSSIPQPYEFLGKMLDQAGPHLGEVTKDYEAWVQREPQNARAQLLLAKALLIADPQSARAADLLRSSSALDPKDWEPHYELGAYLEAQHDYRAAAAELEQSTQLNPKEPMPHYHLARVYARLGETDKAQAEREIHQRLTGVPRGK